MADPENEDEGMAVMSKDLLSEPIREKLSYNLLLFVVKIGK